MGEGDTVLNALFGAVVAVVLSFLPFSPLLGGLAAGYLEGGERADGLRVGALAGGIALVPLAGIALLFGAAIAAFVVGGLPVAVGALGAVLLALLIGAFAVYTVGLAALGGWLGNYLTVDTDVGG